MTDVGKRGGGHGRVGSAAGLETLEGRMLLTAVVTGNPFGGAKAASTGAITMASFTTSEPLPVAEDYTDATTASAVATAPVSGEWSAGLSVYNFNVTPNTPTGQLNLATFNDYGPESFGAPTATIDWGDGTQSAGNFVPTGGGAGIGEWWVQGGHTYAAPGQYTMRVTVSNANGISLSQVGWGSVEFPFTAVATPVTGTQGTAATVTLATFTDDNPLAVIDDYAATIDWGDGSTSAGTIVAGALGGWEVRGAHAYATPGSKFAWVTITGVGGAGGMTFVNTTATIANPAMHGSGVNTSGLRAHTWTDVVAHFSDDNPMASAGDYAVTIDWGDGQSSAGTVAANSGGGWDVIGTHAYAVPGTFAVATTITDGDGGTVTTASTAVPRNPRYLRYPLGGKGADVSVLRGRTFNGPVAVLTNPFPDYANGDLSGTIDWGDGSSSAATFVRTPAGTWTVNGTHAWATKGTYGVTVTLNDSLARTATVRTEATVLRPKSAGVASAPGAAPRGNHRDPDAVQPGVSGVDVTATRGSEFSGTLAHFHGSNRDWAASQYAVTIDWGDGHQSVGTITPSERGGFEVVGSHAYDTKGLYNVTITLVDPTNVTWTAQSLANVKRPQILTLL
jgi:hypothetical protein